MTTQVSGIIPGGGPVSGAMAQFYQCAGAPVAAVNDIQTITVDACTHSTLTLKGLPGGLTYAAVQDVSTAALATALNTLLGASSVGVTGTYSAGSGGTYIITWSGGNYAGKTMSLLSVTATFVGGSTPAVAIVHTTPGVAATFGAVAPPGALLVDTTNHAIYVNTGSQLVPTWSNTANTLSGAQAITATDANAFDVGQAGTTNPALKVDTSTASSATGVTIKSAAAAGGVAVTARSSGTDEALKIDAKGAGTLTLQGTATGGVITPRTLTTESGQATTGGGGAAGLLMGTGAFGIYFGSGAPTISAAHGSLYIRSDGSSTSTRLYVNSDGATTWVAVTTAS